MAVVHLANDHLPGERPEIPAGLIRYDCAVIATNHSAFDYEMIAENSRLVVDTRGAMRHLADQHDHIVSA